MNMQRKTAKPLTTLQALQNILDYLERNNLPTLHTSTQIMIAPSYEYHVVRTMITNFHQPQSTLLLLVSALSKEIGGASITMHWSTTSVSFPTATAVYSTSDVFCLLRFVNRRMRI